jgi:putative ABC transport system substrate-binding protein
MIGRRQFISLLGGAATAWPVAARGQQLERMRRVGVLMARAADDPAGQVGLVAFVQGLQNRGWTVGRNVSIDIRWGAGDPDRYRTYAAELVALDPDVILASTTTPVRALLQVTRSVPIVFAAATDPVGGGLVASLPHPGGNVTGFLARELGFSAKWLELLKEVAPPLKRVAVLRDSTTTGGVGQFAAIQTAAPAFRVELTPIDLRDASEIESAVRAFARQPNGGLIMISASRADLHRKLIIALATQHRLPAIYPHRLHVAEGGLISYGTDQLHLYRLAASYVDRILKGEDPADLPVQAPTKYELVINLKTAKTLGIDVPPMLLARADEVIE